MSSLAKGGRSYSEHIELLQEVVLEQFGATPQRIVSVLASYGPLSLFDTAEACRAVRFVPVASSSAVGGNNGVGTTSTSHRGGVTPLDDGDIKTSMAVLHQHNVVGFDDSDKTYHLRIGCGLVRCFLPLLLRHCRSVYGDSGVVLATLLFELGPVPSNTLLTIAVQRHPSLHAALDLSLQQMRGDGLIVSSDTTEAELASLREPVNKKAKKEGYPLQGMLSTCTLNVPLLLNRLRSEAVISFIASRSEEPAVVVRIFRTLIQADTSIPKLHKDREDGFPCKTDVSSSVSLLNVREALPDVREETFHAVISRIASAEGGNLISRSDPSALDMTYRLNYTRVVDAMTMSCCEGVILARYGVLGVRVMKALLKFGAMEDRFVAEEVIATLQQTRDVITAMMRDGFLRQQEVPRTLSVDRQPKHSVFLWVMNRDTILTTTAAELVKSLRNARQRLRVEEERLLSALPEALRGAEKVALSPQEEKARRLGQHAIRVLKGTIAALSEQILIMNYY